MDILIADDHTLFREGLRYVLGQIDEVLEFYETGTCAEALQFASDNRQLDLILLDLALQDGNGLEVLPRFREQAPSVPVIVVSATEDANTIRKALELGAQGYIPKSTTGKAMLAAVQLVLSGGKYLPPALLDGGISQSTGSTGRSGSKFSHGLTLRQLEVLSLIAKGLPNKEICKALNVTEGTIKIHVTAVFKALKVSNRTQAVLVAQQMGLTPAGIGSTDA